MEKHYPADSPEGDQQMYQIAMKQHKKLRAQYRTPVPSPVSPEEEQATPLEARCSTAELDEDDDACHQYLMEKEEREGLERAAAAAAAEQGEGPSTGSTQPEPQSDKWAPVMGDTDKFPTPPITLWQKSQVKAPAGKSQTLSP